MIRLLLERDRAEEALLYLERFKARTFLELISYGNTQLRATPKLIEDEQYLAARIRYLNTRMNTPLSLTSGAGSFADLQQELDLAQEQYEQLLLQIKLQYPEYYRLKIVDAEEIRRLIRDAQQLLEENIAILEYFFDDRQMHVWILEKDRLHSVSVPVSQYAVIERVLRFRSGLSERESDEIFTVLEELYSWLIRPAEPICVRKRSSESSPFKSCTSSLLPRWWNPSLLPSLIGGRTLPPAPPLLRRGGRVQRRMMKPRCLPLFS